MQLLGVALTTLGVVGLSSAGGSASDGLFLSTALVAAIGNGVQLLISKARAAASRRRRRRRRGVVPCVLCRAARRATRAVFCAARGRGGVRRRARSVRRRRFQPLYHREGDG